VHTKIVDGHELEQQRAAIDEYLHKYSTYAAAFFASAYLFVRLMALAGLWETWRSPAGERVRSFAIATTAANALLAEVHDRMPVFLAPWDWPAWLGETPAGPEQLKSLLVPYPAEDNGRLAGGQASRKCREQGPLVDRARRGPRMTNRADETGRRVAEWGYEPVGEGSARGRRFSPIAT
jgi:hypothetical protein